MSLTFVGNQTLATETCIKCGVLFAMPETWQAEFRRTHQIFMCPAGHSQFYPGETDAEKLRKQVAQLQTTIERNEAYEATLRAEKSELRRKCSAVRGVVTRIKNRVGAGVCPCCNRSFQCLARHMETKHPDFRQSPT